MALEFEKLSTHLKEVLLNLKHMSPTQRFNEVSKPRFELQWQTVAFRYGMEKMERQAWMIPDQEILNPTSKSSPQEILNPTSNTSPLINTDCTDQKQGRDLPQRAQRTRRKTKRTPYR